MDEFSGRQGMSETPLAWRAGVFAASLLGFVALAWLVATGGAADFDGMVRAAAHDLSSPALTSAMLALTHLGSVAVISVISVGACAGFSIARQHQSAWLLAGIMVGSAVLENGLKFAFQRARPEPFFALGAPETYSFPSGHSLFSACLYGAIAWRLAATTSDRVRRSAIWGITLALIAVVGYSRLYLGVHYPTDVLGGWLVAAFWLAAVSVWASARISRNTERLLH
jgi:undecaprenyl-diphosphatase